MLCWILCIYIHTVNVHNLCWGTKRKMKVYNTMMPVRSKQLDSKSEHLPLYFSINIYIYIDWDCEERKKNVFVAIFNQVRMYYLYPFTSMDTRFLKFWVNRYLNPVWTLSGYSTTIHLSDHVTYLTLYMYVWDVTTWWRKKLQEKKRTRRVEFYEESSVWQRERILSPLYHENLVLYDV